MRASDVPLEHLYDRSVRASSGFSGIPAGRLGRVVRVVLAIGAGGHVLVRWTTEGGHVVEDQFNRDGRGDETDLLEVVE